MYYGVYGNQLMLHRNMLTYPWNLNFQMKNVILFELLLNSLKILGIRQIRLIEMYGVMRICMIVGKSK